MFGGALGVNDGCVRVVGWLCLLQPIIKESVDEKKRVWTNPIHTTEDAEWIMCMWLMFTFVGPLTACSLSSEPIFYNFAIERFPFLRG